MRNNCKLLACVLIQNTIYCYSGGYVPIGNIGGHITSDEFHSLDLTQNLAMNTDQWNCLYQDGYAKESAMGSSIALASNTSLILDGGYSSNVIINVTKIYDEQDSKWTTIPETDRSIQGPM